MHLSAGTRIGSYEVVDLLGEGGMGQVYRARDHRLGRDVALKILPEALATDPERRSRFEREARVLASLNHPNIAAIYGLEENALVMELVDGDDLAEIISGRRRSAPAALDIQDAVPIARQIASALEAAHEHGIIHRDLKPSNVKVTPDGIVKVLDFGLAKAIAPDTSSGTDEATMTSPAATGIGVILGTAAYMSPEQARGRVVDKRTDIWAFGLVLYEMLTGLRAYARDTVSDTLAAILTSTPDLSLLPDDAPPAVRRLLARCLDPDPRRRLRDIGEARVALESPSDTSMPSTTLTPASRSRPRPWPIVAVALIAIAAAAIAGWWYGSRQATSAPTARTVVQLTDQSGVETSPAISPDGVSFAYATRALGSWDIYVQRVGGRNPVLAAGDPQRDEQSPAFSPDGRSIAFHESDADGGIFIAGATGESARRLTDFGFHPSWSPDGASLVFCTEEIDTPVSRQTTSQLWVVDLDAGAPRKLIDGDAVQPSWSPSGQRIAYWSATGGQRDVFTVAAAGGTPVPITMDKALDWSPVWAADGRAIYFASDRGGAMNLWRVAVDETTGAASAAPESLTLGVHTASELPAVSHDGTKVVFRAMLTAMNPAALPFDADAARVGEPALLFRRTSQLVTSDVSRDGQWLAFVNAGERREDLFICRVDGKDLTRLTDDDARDRFPRWTPDGKGLAFYSNRSGTFQIWMIGRDGGALRQVTDYTDELYFPLFAPDGREMIVSVNRPGKPLVRFNPHRPWTEQTAAVLPLDLPDDWYGATGRSPNGRLLSGRITNRAGVASALGVYDVESGTLTAMGSPGTDFPTVWLPDNRRVVGMTGGGRLVLYDTVSRTDRRIALPAGVVLNHWSFAIAPDGRTLYASIVEHEADIWMLEIK